MKRVHQTNAELLSAEDVPGDVASVTTALQQARAEPGTDREFEIPKGTRFTCLSLKGVSLAEGLSEPLDLGGGLWALFTPPFEIPEHWQQWLGSLQTRYFSGSNLFILAVLPSDQIGTSDRDLKQKVWSYLYAILMQGIPHYNAGLSLTGENSSGAVDVKSATTLFQYYRPAKVDPARIGKRTLKSATVAAAGLQTIYAEQQDYRRLKRGFEAWLRGVREGEGIQRLYQFVRAVEAVLKPSPRQTRSQFIHRCRLFAGGSDEDRILLGELYDLRRCVEHMNDWREVLKPDPSELDQDTIGWKRAYQAELLASHVYLRILEKGSLLENFIDDKRIDQFWEEPNWGKPIDLEAEAGKRFLDSDREV